MPELYFKSKVASNMNKIKLKIVLIAACFAGLGTFVNAQIEFVEVKSKADWDQAFESARQEEKLVFLDIYATWCGPCKYLENNVYVDSLLGLYYNRNFINLKMDGESEFGRTIAGKYSLRAFPTMYYIDDSEDLIIDIVGVREAGPLLALGENVNQNGEKLSHWETAHEEGVLNYEELIEYQTLLNSLEQTERANELGSEIINTMGMVELMDPKNKDLVLGATYNLDSKVFSTIKENAEVAYEVWGEEGVEKLLSGIYNDALFEAITNKDQDLIERVIDEFIPVYTKGDSMEIERGEYITRKVFLANTGMWEKYESLVEHTMLSRFPGNDDFLRGEAYELVNEYNRDPEALSLAYNWSKEVSEMNRSFDNLLLLAYLQGMHSDFEEAKLTVETLTGMDLSEEQKGILLELNRILDQASSKDQ